MTDTHDKDLEARKWKHRRRMAYSALVGLGVVLVKVMVDPTGLTTVMDIVKALLYTLGAIVMAYMGLSTFEHWGKK